MHLRYSTTIGSVDATGAQRPLLLLISRSTMRLRSMFCPLAIIWWMTDSTWFCVKPIEQISATTCAVDICDVAGRAWPCGGAGASLYLQTSSSRVRSRWQPERRQVAAHRAGATPVLILQQKSARGTHMARAGTTCRKFCCAQYSCQLVGLQGPRLCPNISRTRAYSLIDRYSVAQAYPWRAYLLGAGAARCGGRGPAREG